MNNSQVSFLMKSLKVLNLNCTTEGKQIEQACESLALAYRIYMNVQTSLFEADPVFLERGFVLYKGMGVHIADCISFFLKNGGWGCHCFQSTHLGVSSLQRVKSQSYT